MNKKNKFTIEEKQQIKRETIAVAIGASLAAILILTTVSCASCIGRCVNKKDKQEDDKSSYEILDDLDNNHRLELKYNNK